jgi:type I restriction enzyme S subunit
VSKWKKVKIGILADSISETHSFNKKELIFLNTSDIYEGKVLNTSYSQISAYPGQAKKSIKKDDILLSEIRPANKRYAFINFQADDYVVSTKLMVIRSKGEVLPKYLYYFLTSREISQWLQHLAESRSGTFPQITFDQVADLDLNLPAKDVQEKIVSIVENLDDKIELNRRMNETLQAMARATFKSWFADFDPVSAKMECRWRRSESLPGLPADLWDLFPERLVDSELGQIPDGWDVWQIGNIGRIICGKTPRTQEVNYYGDDMPFITIPDMHGQIFATATQKRLSWAGTASQPNKMLPAGAICVSCIATPGLVVITSEPAQTNQQINTVVPSRKDETYFWFWSLRYLGDEIRAGGSGGSVLTNLSTGRFAELHVLSPPAKLRSSYHFLVTPLFGRILENKHETITLAALRSTLLPKLISGELKVKNAEGFVQEVV